MAIAQTSLPRLGTALIIRALPTLAAAVVITFSRNHASVVGLSVFVGFGLVLAAVLLWTVFMVPLEGLTKTLVGIQAITSAVAAAVAAASLGGGLPALILVISIWAAVTGALELYAGYREAQKAASREWLVIGAFTALLAIVEAAIPMNDVYAVGIFGAYAAVLGVFQIIAGISLRADSQKVQNEESS